MTSPFTRMMAGEVPARWVWRDDRCVALMADEPVRMGHVIVVPRLEVDHWCDLPDDLAAHVMSVMARIARAQRQSFPCAKVGVAILGLQVRHAHVHLVPVNSPGDLDLAAPRAPVDSAALDLAHASLLHALAESGESCENPQQ